MVMHWFCNPENGDRYLISAPNFNKGIIIIMNSIKDMVKDKTVRFLYFKENDLFYTTECGFEFPVPISDVGTASMNATDKAILYMRWIRKEIDVRKVIDKLKAESAANLEKFEEFYSN